MTARAASGPVDDPLLSTLRFCRERPAWHFVRLGDRVAEAQRLALQRGWLAPSPYKPGYLAITLRGKHVLAAWETAS